MGFAVPAAIGVQLARPGRPVWAISGDGGFQMNLQEIATMVQEQIPVKMAVFNNGYLGMVRQWQQFFHGRRYSATPIWSPDFVKLADAYGIAGYRVEDAGQIEDVVARATAEPGPALVEFLIEQEANVFPDGPAGGLALGIDRGRAGCRGGGGVVIPTTISIVVDEAMIPLDRALGVVRRRNLRIDVAHAESRGRSRAPP